MFTTNNIQRITSSPVYGKLFKLCCYELKRIEMCNYVFNIVFLFEGRVQCHREVYIPEANRSIVFYVCCREKGIVSFGDIQ